MYERDKLRQCSVRTYFGRLAKTGSKCLCEKLQIMQMLADARLKQGAAFSLRNFHDYVWLNGNVPIVLQRWEYLGTSNEAKKLGTWK